MLKCSGAITILQYLFSDFQNTQGCFAACVCVLEFESESGDVSEMVKSIFGDYFDVGLNWWDWIDSDKSKMSINPGDGDGVRNCLKSSREV